MTAVKLNPAETSGVLLDYLVCLALAKTDKTLTVDCQSSQDHSGERVWKLRLFKEVDPILTGSNRIEMPCNFHDDWELTGRILDQEQYNTSVVYCGVAAHREWTPLRSPVRGFGDNYKEAILRTFVLEQLGGSVDFNS